MANIEVLLKELRDFCQESNVSLGEIKQEMFKMKARMDEAEGWIERAKERIQNTEDTMTEIIKLQTRLEDKLRRAARERKPCSQPD